jgi:hypothetical protein
MAGFGHHCALADDVVMTRDPAEVHRSMMATKADSVLKASMEMSQFRQHLKNPLYGVQASITTSHGAFATKMADAVVAGGKCPLPWSPVL